MEEIQKKKPVVNYNGRKFKPLGSSENSETTSETVFHYQQTANILTASYKGGDVVEGHLIGIVSDASEINMRYHHINTKGELMTGVCKSVPEILPSGKIKIHEDWKWTSGDLSEGKSTLIEI